MRKNLIHKIRRVRIKPFEKGKDFVFKLVQEEDAC